MKKTTFASILLLLCTPILTLTVMAQEHDLEAQLEEINSYVRISETLSTSGQVAYDQVEAIAQAGFEVVINLAPANEDMNSLEGYLAVQEGMTYIHIPVSWREPSQRDLQLFFEVMRANEGRKVYVHCFANMRVSAFVYLYRTLKKGEAKDLARTDLEKIWKPEESEQWAAFIETAQKGD